MYEKKLEWDTNLVDWPYWTNIQSISAKDACWLVCGVDPNICNNDSIESKYTLSDKKKIEIKNALTQVESDIRSEREKKYNSPWGWVCWAESKGIPVAEQFHELAYKANLKNIRLITTQPLEEISNHLLARFMKQDSWSYYEAIFLIHGYKPPGDIEGFDEIRTHFPKEYLMLERAIEVGVIGKKVTRAGEVTFVDMPESWIAWGKTKGISCERLAKSYEKNKNPNSLKIGESFVEVSDISESKQIDKQDVSWVIKAKEKADSIFKKQKDMGCDPSKKAIASIIAKEFEQEGIKTVKGKRLNDEYIVRHALNTWIRPEK